MTDIKRCPVCSKEMVYAKDPGESTTCLMTCPDLHVGVRGSSRGQIERAFAVMSAPTDRRCGTCEWWYDTGDQRQGLCDALPMFHDDHRHYMSGANGVKCALWRLREGGAE